MPEAYLQQFRFSIENIKKKTLDSQNHPEMSWNKLRQLWEDHYNQIPNEIILQREKLLMAVRYTECLQGIQWIEWLVIHGGYHQGMRELRSILEGTIQAYYIDKNYHDIDVKGKLAVLREMNSSGSDYGTKMINKAQPPDSKKIIALYKELSKFVHTSSDHLHEILSIPDSDQRIVELIAPQFDEELFQKCYKFTERVLKLVITTNQDLIISIQ